MTSPFAPLNDLAAAAAQPARAPVYVDEDTFAKLCEHPNAQRYILDPYADGVTVDGCVTVDGVGYRVIFATARALVNVDADTFAKLCERPNAQRRILDGFPCVDLDGVTYRHADSLPGPDDDGGDL